MTLYLSRLVLNRHAPARAIMSLINPDNSDLAADAHHKLIWTLFGDAKDRDRDFLWRYDGKDRFYTLSHRPPLGNDLFGDVACKEFAPALIVGDRLSFVLRANATRAKRALKDAKGRSKKVDVAMDALYQTRQGERAQNRHRFAEQAATDWMKAQGGAYGFSVNTLKLYDYSVLKLGQGRRDASRQFGLLDMNGIITVTDPKAFAMKYAQGFGRAKAWGCGLMMIRRAPDHDAG